MYAKVLLRSTSLHSFEKEFGTEFWVFHLASIGVVSGKSFLHVFRVFTQSFGSFLCFRWLCRSYDFLGIVLRGPFDEFVMPDNLKNIF